MELDARGLVRRTLEADVCVIGSGPAGLSLAREFVDSGARVIVLESGDRQFRAVSQTLSGGTTLGDRYSELSLTRCRRIGGTTHLWNTWIGSERVGKYVPLDHLDFEPRPWLPLWPPLAGWPFPAEELDPYYARAQHQCGLSTRGYAAADWLAPDEALLPMPEDEFVSSVHQLGPGRHFGQDHAEAIRGAGNVLLCTNATATELMTDPREQKITLALAICDPGEALRVSARLFVLAAGGIENARLLLLSNRRHAGGLGNRYDMVGRCFMEHPRDFSCVLVPRNRAQFEHLGFYDVHGTSEGAIRGRIGLTEAAMRRERLPNLSITLRRRPMTQTQGGTNGDRPPHYFELEINFEQMPDLHNRVMLGGTLDPLGQPRVKLHWTWTEADRRHRERALAFLVERVARSGFGRIEMHGTDPPDPNAHHHMGTTRMSHDPRYGVVDADARVHGLSNLFVAGSSVFPTGGFANPTLTIVALSLRLADHLKRLLPSPPRFESRRAAATRAAS